MTEPASDSGSVNATSDRVCFTVESKANICRSLWLIRGHQIPKLLVFQICSGALTISVAILLIVLAFATSCGQPSDEDTVNSGGKECQKPGCLLQSAEMLSYMNASCNPCQDFYQYACGGFNRRYPRRDRKTFDVKDLLSDHAVRREQELLEEPADNRTAAGKARIFYQSCVNANNMRQKLMQWVRDRNLVNTTLLKDSERLSNADICLNLIWHFMYKAEQGLFIHEHLGPHQLEKAKEVVRQVTQAMIDAYPWMSKEARADRKFMLERNPHNYGHSNEVINLTELNQIYRPLNLNVSNFLSNLDVLYDFDQSPDLKKAYYQLPPRQAGIWYTQDRLNVPYGALQPPWFDAHNPSAVNLAGLGLFAMEQLTAVVLFKENHRHRWSASTRKRVHDYRVCVNASVSKSAHKPIRRPRQSIPEEQRYPDWHLARLRSAFELTQKLFQRTTDNKETPTQLPGLGRFTQTQLFYLGYAQSRCVNIQPGDDHITSYFGSEAGPTLINHQLLEDEHFLQAFGCPTASGPSQSHQCALE